MIRVNLLKHMGAPGAAAATGAAAAIDPAFGGSIEAGSDANKAAALKIVAMLLPAIAAYAYQKYDAAAQEAETQAIRAQAVETQGKVAKLGDVGPKVEKFRADQKRLAAQLGTLKGLSRLRLREVKALDAIQNVMPQKTWLTNIRFDPNVVNLQGYATSEEGYPELQRALEGSMFRDVEPKNSSQEAAAAGSALYKFEVEFKVGRNEKQEP